MTPGQTLSNGHCRAVITAAGAGYSSLGDLLLTRWRDDPTCEANGWFLYLRDLESGGCWSAGHQPVQHLPERYQVQLGKEMAVIVREDDGIELRTEVVIGRDADIEWRRYTVTNHSDRRRLIEATTYAEAVLAPADADAGHPAFSKLFVQTEFLPALGAVLARRRPRAADDRPLYLIHAFFGPAPIAEFETDRARFIGRGRNTARPAAMDTGARLSCTVGDVLDPILSLRHTLSLEPGASVRMHAVLAAGDDRAKVEGIVLAAQHPAAAEQAFAGRGSLDPPVSVTFPRAGRFTPAPGVDAQAPGEEALRFFNGHGGFTAAGDEYVIRLDRSRDGLSRPPLPWTNVIANETTGFVASESGLGFTWSGNSRLNRLTPWFNDPVSDPVGEALYLRDEEAGVFWSPTPAPTPGGGGYQARHGFGYTSWRHDGAELDQVVTCFVARHDPVKIVRLRVTNRGHAPRRLSAYYFAEWVLGGYRPDAAGGVITEGGGGGKVILATNPANGAFAERVAFAMALAPTDASCSFTADRQEFLGRHGAAAAPRALCSSERLAGRTGAGLDPCAAFQCTAEIGPGVTAEWVFLLGQAGDRAEVAEICARLTPRDAIEKAFQEVRAFWRQTLTSVQVETPSPEIDLMLNGWLSYQNLSCRIWARSAFYQSGGAFGYRDQLQDASAMISLAPDLTRRQILLHARHQFVEGDVMHWWHPPASLGIRTRFSDDLLWLPYVTEHYVNATGDALVLDEEVEFLTGHELPAGEDEVLLEPGSSGVRVDVYQHCCLAIDRSLTRGAHGLPLMGSGDWNDGMNRVGRLGRGESIWLGFFLCTILERFIPICRRRGDVGRVNRYQGYRAELITALNTAGWDGGWYRRAYYDDGEPMGSAASDECRIDLIAQAWAVLSGVASEERAATALGAMERFLVDEPAGLIRLLTPPFDRTPHDPGYIKGYLPGVRENGGQYTHAALWAVRALAEAGHAERACRLFEMLTPVRRGGTPEAIAKYLAEPYVIAADVYGVAPHVGRGGWTWYTGSAGWMYRVGLESILGLTIVNGTTLVLRPCIPAAWPGFAVRYRLPAGGGEYRINVRRTTASTTASSVGLEVIVVDGAVRIPLVAGGIHEVAVELGDDLQARYRPRSGMA